MEKYFILKNTEDGISVNMVDKEELLKRITPDENGYSYYGDKLKFVDHIPRNVDGYFENMPHDSLIIIKGDFIIPKQKEVVVSYEL